MNLKTFTTSRVSHKCQGYSSQHSMCVSLSALSIQTFINLLPPRPTPSHFDVLAMLQSRGAASQGPSPASTPPAPAFTSRQHDPATAGATWVVSAGPRRETVTCNLFRSSLNKPLHMEHIRRQWRQTRTTNNPLSFWNNVLLSYNPTQRHVLHSYLSQSETHLYLLLPTQAGLEDWS